MSETPAEPSEVSDPFALILGDRSEAVAAPPAVPNSDPSTPPPANAGPAEEYERDEAGQLVLTKDGKPRRKRGRKPGSQSPPSSPDAAQAQEVKPLDPAALAEIEMLTTMVGGIVFGVGSMVAGSEPDGTPSCEPLKFGPFDERKNIEDSFRAIATKRGWRLSPEVAFGFGVAGYWGRCLMIRKEKIEARKANGAYTPGRDNPSRQDGTSQAPSS